VIGFQDQLLGGKSDPFSRLKEGLHARLVCCKDSHLCGKLALKEEYIPLFVVGTRNDPPNLVKQQSHVYLARLDR
jgi:hypothetical protein